MEIEDSTNVTLQKQRFKPNRLCIIVSIVCFVLIVCFYRYLHLLPKSEHTVNDSQPVKLGKVNILLDEKNPYNVTVTSNMDIIQSYDIGGALVEISVKDLLANETNTPVRIIRSGKKYDVHVSYSEEQTDRRYRLTGYEEIKPNIYNIFFIESRCGLDSELQKRSPDDGAVFNARQVCAIESTARMNPNRPVYILHTCPLDNTFYEKSPKYFQELMSYKNVHLVQLKMSDLFLRTNVEDLYFSGKFEESKYPIAHISDVMRLLTLWKFGGTYMDIDVVSIRPLDNLGVNYAGWQDEQTVATGVMNFADTGFGHAFLTQCLESLKFSYDPHNWSTNGPILFTRLLADICSIYSPKSKCTEFTAYAIPVFYPIYYTNWRLFFEEKYSDHTLKQLNETYIVHIWNKMSSKGVIRVGSKQAYAILADEYCPKAYHNCGIAF